MHTCSSALPLIISNIYVYIAKNLQKCHPLLVSTGYERRKALAKCNATVPMPIILRLRLSEDSTVEMALVSGSDMLCHLLY